MIDPITPLIYGYLKSRAGTDETGALQLQQALNSGKIGADEARALCEHSPRFVSMLIDGLVPIYGKLTFRTFIEYAARGLITKAAISRAMT